MKMDHDTRDQRQAMFNYAHGFSAGRWKKDNTGFLSEKPTFCTNTHGSEESGLVF